jgi:hypothetical protein
MNDLLESAVAALINPSVAWTAGAMISTVGDVGSAGRR